MNYLPTRAHSAWYSGQDFPLDPVTPGVILARMRQTDGQYESFAADVAASTIPSPAFKLAWKRQYDAWKQFYNDNGPGLMGFMERLSAQTMTETNHYVDVLLQWGQAFQRLTGQGPTGPRPLTPAPQNEGMDATLTKVAIIAGIVVAGIIVIEVVPVFKH